MDTGLLVAILVVIVLLALLAFFAGRQRRSRQLQDRFGPEYDRTVSEAGRSEGEKRLVVRRKRVERYDHRIIRVDVELYHERNPRQSAACQRVEVTCATRGPVVRSEACASDFYRALDAAVTKLETRMRRAADRRRVHRGSRTPTSVAVATSAIALNGATPVATLQEEEEQEEAMRRRGAHETSQALKASSAEQTTRRK